MLFFSGFRDGRDRKTENDKRHVAFLRFPGRSGSENGIGKRIVASFASNEEEKKKELRGRKRSETQVISRMKRKDRQLQE